MRQPFFYAGGGHLLTGKISPNANMSSAVQEAACRYYERDFEIKYDYFRTGYFGRIGRWLGIVPKAAKYRNKLLLDGVSILLGNTIAKKVGQIKNISKQET